MSVVIETTLGDITVDLFIEQRPVTCLNFLKLCKMKYYNFNLFHSIRSGFIAQTGDPTAEGGGGQSIFGVLEGPSKRFFSGEKLPKIRHTNTGTLSMVCTGEMMVGSQFFFTLAPDLDSLDSIHCVIGEVTEGHDVLRMLNDVICNENHRPYRDVRITHTVVLEDPFNDPAGLHAPSRSPSPSAERLKGGRIAADEDIDEAQGKSAAEIQELIEEKEAKARATILEIVGDLPDADIAPPENVLFVCKLNPVTSDEDLEIIFSRFGKIIGCEVIRDKKTGDSLQYAFVEFEDKKSCEDAYFKMDNVLIDDRRIHVDFSQSVSRMRWLGKGRGIRYFNEDSKDKNGNTTNQHLSKSGKKSDYQDQRNGRLQKDNMYNSEDNSNRKSNMHRSRRSRDRSRSRRDHSRSKYNRSNGEDNRSKRRSRSRSNVKTSKNRDQSRNKTDKSRQDRKRSNSRSREEKSHRHRHSSPSASRKQSKHQRSRSRSRPKVYKPQRDSLHRKERSSSKKRDKIETINQKNRSRSKSITNELVNPKSRNEKNSVTTSISLVSSHHEPESNVSHNEKHKTRNIDLKIKRQDKRKSIDNEDLQDKKKSDRGSKKERVNETQRKQKEPIIENRNERPIDKNIADHSDEEKVHRISKKNVVRTPTPVKTGMKQKNKNKKKERDTSKKTSKRKHKYSSSSDSESSSSSSSESSSSEEDRKKKTLKRKRKTYSSSSTSTSTTSSSSSSSSSTTSSDSSTSSSSSDSEPIKKKRKKNASTKVVKQKKDKKL